MLLEDLSEGSLSLQRDGDFSWEWNVFFCEIFHSFFCRKRSSFCAFHASYQNQAPIQRMRTWRYLNGMWKKTEDWEELELESLGELGSPPGLPNVFVGLPDLDVSRSC